MMKVNEQQASMNQRGFTIPELLVALLAFSLVVGGASNLLLTAIVAQRNSLATQELLDQTSYMAEYMTRVLRQAQKDLGATCLTEGGLNYEVSSNGTDWFADGTGNRVRFLNNGGQCHEFRLQEARIQEFISPAPAEYLTSDNLEVLSLQFVTA
ncbi:MAG: prepilin-type N-terminal cleavage/methylation domain-containing protein, partial [bacterium]|nr:prepilin-type N-terminal cleavage/methylation domain-containing protein [bacterium]